jgi:hypothetical protein
MNGQVSFIKKKKEGWKKKKGIRVLEELFL